MLHIPGRAQLTYLSRQEISTREPHALLERMELERPFKKHVRKLIAKNPQDLSVGLERSENTTAGIEADEDGDISRQNAQLCVRRPTVWGAKKDNGMRRLVYITQIILIG